MISKRDLKEQRMMGMLIDLHEMGDDLVEAIEQADWKNVKRFKTPTPRMESAVSMWKSYWDEMGKEK